MFLKILCGVILKGPLKWTNKFIPKIKASILNYYYSLCMCRFLWVNNGTVIKRRMSVLHILFTKPLLRESLFPDSRISSICLRKINLSRIKMFPFQPSILQISAKMLFIPIGTYFLSQELFTGIFHRKNFSQETHGLYLLSVYINNCEDGTHIRTYMQTFFILWTVKVPSQEFRERKIRICSFQMHLSSGKSSGLLHLLVIVMFSV